MRRINQVGFDAAVQEEIEHPTWENADWARMLVAFATGTPTKWATEDERTYRCPRCKDSGFLPIEDVERGGSIYAVTTRCDPCAWRLWAKAEWLRKQEREGSSRSSRLRESAGDSD
jgi:hypothetical protein